MRRRLYYLLCLTYLLSACATTPKPVHPPHMIVSTKTASELAAGQNYFNRSYYKRAMHTLLPLACDGIPEAQYAVGYMYYYGYGVAQDTDIGYFWIDRAAQHQYPPAMEAARTIQQEVRPQRKIYPKSLQ